MRVALVSQEYPPDTGYGGIGTQARAKAEGLAARGHEVVVVSAGGGDACRERDEDGVRVVRLAAPDRRLPLHAEPARWVAWSVEVAAALERLLAEAPLDLVELAEWGAEGYTWLLNRAEWSRVPAIVHVHGPLVMLAGALGWPEPGSELHRVGMHMEGTCLRLADRVYASSACSRDWCARGYGIDPAAVPVIHAGVDTSRFRPRPAGAPRGGPPTLLFAGKIARNKGVEDLLEAAIGLAPRFPGLRLRMLGRGEGDLAARLTARARDAGHGELLELPGFAEPEALAAELREADVFAAPSLYEGGPGLVYLEAMASGLPVVGCSGSGVEEAVTGPDTGCLVPPGDVAALAGTLERLLASPGERAALGARARAWVERHAARGPMLDRIEALYRDTAAAAPRAGSGGAP